jgi:hypothetical protein
VKHSNISVYKVWKQIEQVGREKVCLQMPNVVTQFETAHELQEDLFKRFETLDEELSIL